MKFGILAGGEGSRLKNEGIDVPKPMVMLNGEPLVYRLIKIFERCDAESISVFVNETMTEVIENLKDFKSSVSCPLEIYTGLTPSSFHSFARLVEFMNPSDKFVVTTVDTVFNEKSFRNYIEDFKKASVGIDGIMGTTFFIDDEKPLYIETENRERGIIRLFSNHPGDGRNEISAGVYGLKCSSLPVIQDSLGKGIHKMRNFQAELVKRGLKLKVFNLGDVVDIDHKQDLELARYLTDSSHIPESYKNDSLCQR